MNLNMLTFNRVSEGEVIASVTFQGDPLSFTVAAFLKHLALPHGPPSTRTIISITYHFAFDAWFAASLRVAVPPN
jgi:hypothetical protein